MRFKISALMQHIIFKHTSTTHTKMPGKCHCCVDKFIPLKYRQKNRLLYSSSILCYCFFFRSVCFFAVGNESSASFLHLCDSFGFQAVIFTTKGLECSTGSNIWLLMTNTILQWLKFQIDSCKRDPWVLMFHSCWFQLKYIFLLSLNV